MSPIRNNIFQSFFCHFCILFFFFFYSPREKKKSRRLNKNFFLLPRQYSPTISKHVKQKKKTIVSRVRRYWNESNRKKRNWKIQSLASSCLEHWEMFYCQFRSFFSSDKGNSWDSKNSFPSSLCNHFKFFCSTCRINKLDSSYFMSVLVMLLHCNFFPAFLYKCKIFWIF